MKFDGQNIKDIAKALKLSTSTVSRALRGASGIKTATKKRVLEYAGKINYRPNTIALNLREGRSRSIGVVVSEIAHSFFAQAISGIESVAYQNGYHVIITQTHESATREKVNMQHLAARGVDGLLVSIASEENSLGHIEELRRKGMPIVLFDRVEKSMPTHKVVANNFNGAFIATCHLTGQGFKRIAHITGPASLSIFEERLEGYKDALRQQDIAYDENLVKFCKQGGMDTEEVEMALDELFEMEGGPPDAFFTTSDKITLLCYQLLKKRLGAGRMGLIGFSNSLLSEFFSPKLSVISQPAFAMGERAAELLIAQLQQPGPVTHPQTTIFEPQLQVRQSSLSGKGASSKIKKGSEKV